MSLYTFGVVISNSNESVSVYKRSGSSPVTLLHVVVGEVIHQSYTDSFFCHFSDFIVLRV